MRWDFAVSIILKEGIEKDFTSEQLVEMQEKLKLQIGKRHTRDPYFISMKDGRTVHFGKDTLVGKD